MDKKDFIERYAPMAIEQQRLYGIPASVTLAQAAIESSWGENVAAREDNNFFGIHATKGWIDSGKPTAWHNDKGMVRFCVYDNVADSFTHHSEFLKQNQRYGACFGLDPTDHRGWAYGICRAGYAERPKDDPDRYARTIEAIIRQNGLEKYDQMGLSPMQPGYSRPVTQPWGQERGRFSFPLAAVDGCLVLTSDIGHRNTGISGASHEHNGVDLRAKYVPVLATEMDGKVVKVDDVGNNKSGKHVIVEYERDGHKYTVSYCHLDKVGVRQGDVVSAGQQIGVSGNSSYRDFNPRERSLDPHLHLTVRKDGQTYDPKQYLAEIAVRGGIDTSLVSKNGSSQDLLAEYKAGVSVPAVGVACSVLGSDLAKLSQGHVGWYNALGQPVVVGEIRVCSLSELAASRFGSMPEGGVSQESLDRWLVSLPEEKREAARQFCERMGAALGDADSRFVMAAEINGQLQVKDISRGEYDQFLAMNNGDRLLQFDSKFDDVAMNDAGQPIGNGPQSSLADICAMAETGNLSGMMDMILKKNGSLPLNGSGEILGELLGMMFAGISALAGLSDSSTDEMLKDIHDRYSAEITPEDQAKIDKQKAEGVDPEDARQRAEILAESGLTALDNENKQQQQVTIRG